MPFIRYTAFKYFLSVYSLPYFLLTVHFIEKTIVSMKYNLSIFLLWALFWVSYLNIFTKLKFMKIFSSLLLEILCCTSFFFHLGLFWVILCKAFLCMWVCNFYSTIYWEDYFLFNELLLHLGQNSVNCMYLFLGLCLFPLTFVLIIFPNHIFHM